MLIFNDYNSVENKSFKDIIKEIAHHNLNMWTSLDGKSIHMRNHADSYLTSSLLANVLFMNRAFITVAQSLEGEVHQ